METLYGQTGTWPTPRVSDTEGGLVQNVEMENGSFSRKNKDGVRWGVKLRDAGESWSTPRVSGQEGYETRASRKGHDIAMSYLESQAEYITKNWPTATASDHKGWSANHKRAHLPSNRLDFQAESQNWPTPTTAEAGKISNRPNYGQQGLSNHPAIVGHIDREKMEKSRQGDGRSTQLGLQGQANQTSGEESLQSDLTSHPPLPKTLSPSFVEWLMGVPIGWTSLKPLEMESYLRWWHCFSGDYSDIQA